MSSALFVLVGLPAESLVVVGRPLTAAPLWPSPRPAPDHLARAPAAQNSGWESQRQYETPHTCPGALLQLTVEARFRSHSDKNKSFKVRQPQIPVGLGGRVAAGGGFAFGLLLFWSDGHGLIACGPASYCYPLPLVSAQRT